MGTMTVGEKKAKLKEKGVLLTIQRSAVLEFLQDNTGHPTAEEIYQSLSERYPALSRATVYNTLALCKQHGIIQEITIERTKAHYDYKTEPHHHFLCRLCTRIYDVDVGEAIHVEPAARLEGHKIEEVRIYITGTCAVCLKAGNDA